MKYGYGLNVKKVDILEVDCTFRGEHKCVLAYSKRSRLYHIINPGVNNKCRSGLTCEGRYHIKKTILPDDRRTKELMEFLLTNPEKYNTTFGGEYE